MAKIDCDRVVLNELRERFRLLGWMGAQGEVEDAIRRRISEREAATLDVDPDCHEWGCLRAVQREGIIK